jgi:hypothetical protein
LGSRQLLRLLGGSLYIEFDLRHTKTLKTLVNYFIYAVPTYIYIIYIFIYIIYIFKELGLGEFVLKKNSENVRALLHTYAVPNCPWHTLLIGFSLVLRYLCR